MTVVNVRQLRACLPVINGGSVCSSGIKVVQARVVLILDIICHLILTLLFNVIIFSFKTRWTQ